MIPRRLPALLVTCVLLGNTAPAQATQTLIVNADQGRDTISRHIYGHFAEHLGRGIYDGIFTRRSSGGWTPRKDVVQALRAIKIPNLRWPGGCFADYYHWKDGIGPIERRPTVVNNNWGGVTEDNGVGTHEFLELTQLLGAEPFIVGNVGSGSVQEMSEWWEYMNHSGASPMADLRRRNGRAEPWNVHFWGIGNESWGCGGNMRPEYYADVYRRYATFVRDYSGNHVYRIASGASDQNYAWSEVLMSQAARQMQGLSLHYYTLPTGNWNNKGSATKFAEDGWHATLARTLMIDEFIQKHSAIMDKYDPQKKVGLMVDEWGTWYDDQEPGQNLGALYQQNGIRDALVAGINLNIFNRHSDRVQMANIAQMVNVLQSMILTDKEKMVLTPTYYVFEMYK